MKKTTLVSILLCCTLLANSKAGRAQNHATKSPEANQITEYAQHERPHREPPAQAYEDCKAKKEGAIVQISTPREGNISATCTNSPNGLFARPQRPPREQFDEQDPGQNKHPERPVTAKK
jgi:hypothetical protein